jgi:hypothetical protein
MYGLSNKLVCLFAHYSMFVQAGVFVQANVYVQV